MNRTDISREKIMEGAVAIVKAHGGAGFDMRSVARYCNVSVGSIYNYFPTKNHLIMAIVVQVWSKAFHSSNVLTDENTPFPQFVENMYKTAYLSQKDFHDFFLMHRSLFSGENRTEGKDTMTQYINHLKGGLIMCLNQDSTISQSLWTEVFTPEALSDFVFENIIRLLSRNSDNCKLLIEILNRLLYGHTAQL